MFSYLFSLFTFKIELFNEKLTESFTNLKLAILKFVLFFKPLIKKSKFLSLRLLINNSSIELFSEFKKLIFSKFVEYNLPSRIITSSKSNSLLIKAF